MSTKQPLCMAPWQALTINPNGEASPCCAYIGKGVPVSDDTKIKEIRSSTIFEEMKRLLIKHEWPNQCLGCQRKETNGYESYRQRFLRKTQHLLKENSYSNDDLIYAELCFSNQCHLTCTMCNSLYSTAWGKIEEQTQRYWPNNRPVAPPTRLTFEQIEECSELASRTPLLEILGGEPMTDPRFLFFLTELEKHKQRAVKYMCITTSLTVFPPQKVLDHLKAIDITALALSLSIDGTDQTYEFIRGWKWNKLQENMLKIIDWSSKTDLEEISLTINPTMSAYNFFSIHKLFDWFIDMRKITNQHKTKFSIQMNQYIVEDDPGRVSIVKNYDYNEYLKQLEKHYSNEHIILKLILKLKKSLEKTRMPSQEELQRCNDYFTKMKDIRKIQNRGIELDNFNPLPSHLPQLRT